MNDALYERLTPERINALYRTTKIRVCEGSYQLFVGDEITHADPIGLVAWARMGVPLLNTGYEHVSEVLMVPLPYVVGFDIAFEGEDPREMVEEAQLGIDPEDPDFWVGAGDGDACRKAFITREVVVD